MHPNKPDRPSLRARILAGEAVLGTFVELPEPTIVEMLGRAGMDFAVVDLEHAGLTLSSVPNIVRAADVVGLPLIGRIPITRLSDVSRVLDTGVQGVLVARVQDQHEARAAVAACRFPPDGDRGACLGIRASDYGWQAWPDYVRRAREQTIVGVAVEGPEGIAAIDDVLATPGLDFVFVGAFDLSSALGHPGELTHPDVVAGLRSVADAARRAGRALAAWGSDPTVGKLWRSLGVTVLTVSTDALMWRDASLRLVAAMADEQA
jgi:2-keto-3-deoxy-L-rhamnonate aldolase RhmA